MTSFIADEDDEVALRLCEGTGGKALESAIETGLSVDVSSKTTCAEVRKMIAADYAEEDARLTTPFDFLRKSGARVIGAHEAKKTMKDCVKVVDDECRYLVLSLEPGALSKPDGGGGGGSTAAGVEESKGGDGDGGDGGGGGGGGGGDGGGGGLLREEDVEVREKLGDGAYGDVLLVVLKLLGGKLTIRAAAKKILHAECRDAKAQLAIKEENARAAKMDHPFVAKAYGSVDMPDGFMIIMELCELGDLKNYAKQNSMPHGLQVQFALQILSAVDYVHTVLRILHRDLAARNFLVTLDEHGVLTVKMCDFGMAREMEGGDRSVYYIKTTLEGGVLNVPVQHTAPEEFGKQEGATGAKFKATPWGDLWAVGIVLWEMVMRGLEPYVGERSIVPFTEGGVTLTKVPMLPRPNEYALIGEYIRKGVRLQTASGCPPVLRLAIEALCATDPTQRPAAGALAVAIAEDGLLRAAPEWGIRRFAQFIRTEATHIELSANPAVRAQFFGALGDLYDGRVAGMLKEVQAGDKFKHALRLLDKDGDLSIDDTFAGGEEGMHYRAFITELEGMAGLHQAANTEGTQLQLVLVKLQKEFPADTNEAVQSLLEGRRGLLASALERMQLEEAEAEAVEEAEAKAAADKAAAGAKAAADKAAAEAKAAADKAAADKAAAEAKAAAAEAEAKAAAAAEAKEAADAAEETKAADPIAAVRALATSVGKSGGIWEGVKRGGHLITRIFTTKRGGGGKVLEIDWNNKGLKGSLPVGEWGMPALTMFNAWGNSELKGRIDQVQWPETLTSIDLRECPRLTGLKELYLEYCGGLTGDLGATTFPPGLQVLSLGDTGVTGDISVAHFPAGLKELWLSGCGKLTGLKELSLSNCVGLTGDKAAAKAKLQAAGCTVYGL